MKRSHDNIEHQIQLKRDEITRYQKAIQNYPEERMQKFGVPHLRKLNTELQELIKLKETK